MFNNPGTYRVHFNIPLAGEEIFMLLNNGGTKSPLPKRITAFIGMISVMYVAFPRLFIRDPALFDFLGVKRTWT